MRARQSLSVGVGAQPARDETGRQQAMSAGRRSLLASTWEPAARTRIRPVPVGIWFAVTRFSITPGWRLVAIRSLTVDAGSRTRANTRSSRCSHFAEVMGVRGEYHPSKVFS